MLKERKARKEESMLLQNLMFLFIGDHLVNKSKLLHDQGILEDLSKSGNFLEWFSQKVFPGLILVTEIKMFFPSLSSGL